MQISYRLQHFSLCLKLTSNWLHISYLTQKISEIRQQKIFLVTESSYQSYILKQGRNQSFDFVARVTFCDRLKVCYMITTCCMWKDRTNSRQQDRRPIQKSFAKYVQLCIRVLSKLYIPSTINTFKKEDAQHCHLDCKNELFFGRLACTSSKNLKS